MKRVIPLILVLLLILPACSSETAEEGEVISIVAATYPVYDFVDNVIQGVDGVEVTLLVNQSVSCLHDYTLTINDMKMLENADLIVLSGAGFEDFITGALSGYPDTPVIDSSLGVDFIVDSDGSVDPHIWLDPDIAALQVINIAEGLYEFDPAHTEHYRQNAETYAAELMDYGNDIRNKFQYLGTRDMVTFHDGFAYFARAFDLNILSSIEEEEGGEASAAEIAAIIDLVKQYGLTAVFTEKNGSTATAEAVARETGAEVYSLDMIISGDNESGYLHSIHRNVETILEAMSTAPVDRITDALGR